MSEDYSSREQHPPQPPSTPEPASHPAESPPVTAGPRVGTIVWGLVLLIMGVFVMSVAFFGDFLDAQLALIAILSIAGIGMLVGAVAQLRRN